MNEKEYIDDLDYTAGLEKHNLKLIKDNLQLKEQLREILRFCNHLHNNCKYRLNDGYIRKIRNICKKALNEKTEVKENEN